MCSELTREKGSCQGMKKCKTVILFLKHSAKTIHGNRSILVFLCFLKILEGLTYNLLYAYFDQNYNPCK